MSSMKMKDINPQESLGLAIKASSKALDRAVESKLEEKSSLTSGQFKVIAALYVKDGQTQKEIADLVFVEGSTLIPIIDRLEKQGYVKRVADKEDRRLNRIYLTDEAKKLEGFVVDCIYEVRKIILKGITAKDLERTRDILRKIVANVEDYEANLEKDNS